MSTPNYTQLNINDLAELRTMVELAVERGAFKASEAKAVGEVYEKLNAFIDQVVKQAQAAETAAKSNTESNQEN